MVPNGWNKKKLGELCYLNPKKPSKPDDGIVSFIAMQQLSESGKVISTDSRSYDDVSKGFTSFVDKDVLVAKITPCFENGKGALVDNLANGIGFGSTEFHVLRAKKGTHPEYIYYLTRTKELRVRGEMNMQGSAGHRRVTADYFNAYKVLTPPLPEQRKIAQILSTWDRGIATTEKLIDASKQQKKALMQQLLTGKKRLVDPETGKAFEGEWEEVKLGDVCIVNPKKASEPENGLVSFIPMDAVSEDAKLLRKEVKQYSEVFKGFTAFIDGDVLVAKITPCFENGKGAQVFGLENGVGFGSTEFHVLRAKKNISSEFIYFLTNTSGFRIRGEMNMQGSAGQKRVTTDYLKLYKMTIPKELAEQQKIASVLTAADKEIELLNAKLAHLKQEKKALMQQLLTGKRRVKVDEGIAA